MVLGYICQEHGYQSECDVTKSGERICYDCGNAVTGLTGHTRGRKAPPSDKPSMQQGHIQWIAESYSSSVRVQVFDHIDAVEKAIKKFDDPQEVNKVYPTKREYRY